MPNQHHTVAMASYLNRLEFLIDKWQSRRMTLEISPAVTTTSRHRGCCQQATGISTKSEQQQQNLEASARNRKSVDEKKAHEQQQQQRQLSPIISKAPELSDYMGEQRNPIRSDSEIKTPSSSASMLITQRGVARGSENGMTNKILELDGGNHQVGEMKVGRQQQQLVRGLRNEVSEHEDVQSSAQVSSARTKAPSASIQSIGTNSITTNATIITTTNSTTTTNTKCLAALLSASLAILALTSCCFATVTCSLATPIQSDFSHQTATTSTFARSPELAIRNDTLSNFRRRSDSASQLQSDQNAESKSRQQSNPSQERKSAAATSTGGSSGHEGRPNDIARSLARSFGSVVHQLAASSPHSSLSSLSSLGYQDRWLNVDSLANSASASALPPASSSSSSLLSSLAIRDHNHRRRQQQTQSPIGAGAGAGGGWGAGNTYLTRALNNLRNRIGSRNSVRVHNAFRDFAWRVLSRLSMPTPVIYELRRQHFYSPEEDQLNDMLFNKNTTRTIRSKRQLSLAIEHFAQSLVSGAAASMAAVGAGSGYEITPTKGRGSRRLPRSSDLASRLVAAAATAAKFNNHNHQQRIGRDEDDEDDSAR